MNLNTHDAHDNAIDMVPFVFRIQSIRWNV